MIKYIEKEYKSIINILKFIDSWFWCKYTLNPYNGCEFACTYCDSRSHKYYLQPELDQLIYIKKDAAEMLDMRIKRTRKLLPDVVAIGGICDAYQKAEKSCKNTKGILEVLRRNEYPVCISTKSTLILRDTDILDEIGRESWCTVGITITTLDKNLSKFLEPKAPLPEERFKVVEELKKSKYIYVGVNFMPIVPFLCDDEKNLEGIVKETKERGADFILSGEMTMRDNQAIWFTKKLNEKYPELIQRYEELYEARIVPGKEYEGRYQPKRRYLLKTQKKLLNLCKKYKLAYRIKRFIPNDFRKVNYTIAEELLNESYERQMTGKSWTKLFWAGQNIQNLKEDIREIKKRGELRKIRNVDEEIEEKIKKHLL